MAASDSTRIHPYSNFESITDFFLAQSCKPPALTWFIHIYFVDISHAVNIQQNAIKNLVTQIMWSSLSSNLVVYFLHILHFSKVISPSVSLAQVFSCEFCEISKKIFFTEHLRVTTSLTEHSIWNQNSSYSVDVCGVLILVIYGFIKRFSVMLVHIICFVVFNSQEFFFLILLLFNSTVVQTQIDKI